jgi:hypothetical protein
MDGFALSASGMECPKISLTTWDMLYLMSCTLLIELLYISMDLAKFDFGEICCSEDLLEMDSGNDRNLVLQCLCNA